MFQIYRGRHEKQYSCLFDPAAKTVYKIKNVFKEFPCANYVGSSHGWLVFFDKSIIHFFNPLSKDCIQLPEIRGVSTAIVSSNPSNNKNFLVVVVVRRRLLFCRNKDKAWTALDDACSSYGYEEIMFHNDHLYALASNKSLDVWDCRESVPMKSMYVPGSDAGVTVIDPTYFLVESVMGEILRVMKYKIQTRTQFLVEKLNSAHQTWEKVEVLGDQILFVFRNQAISISNRSIAGCEENAVYDFDHDSWFSNYAGHGIGQYNLEGDGICKFKREYWMRSRNFFDCPDIYELRYCIDQKPFWIVPTC